MKAVYALIATILIIIAYTPYILDIKRGKTRPHPYTWFISGFITFIVFSLQITHGGGIGTIPTFFGAAAGILIFLLSLGPKRPKITKSDTVFFLMALGTVGIWLLAQRPLLSVVLLNVIDVLAFVPTMRKSWRKPEQETVSTYFVNSARFVFSTAALSNYTLVAVAYPAISIFVDGLSGVYLLVRRHIIKNKV